MRDIIIKKGDEPLYLVMAILMIFMWLAPFLLVVETVDGKKIGDTNRFAPLSKQYCERMNKK